MKISAKGEYGVMALIDLALHQGEGDVQILQISERQKIPKQYLDQLMLILKRSGIVASSRGRQGGYHLAKPAGEITLLEIVTALEGPIENHNFIGKSLPSNQTARQLLHRVWEEIYSHETHLLSSLTLEAVCEHQKRSESQIMYHI
jgi:Rrf2 family protein